jgi:hypothetical protein
MLGNLFQIGLCRESQRAQIRVELTDGFGERGNVCLRRRLE